MLTRHLPSPRAALAGLIAVAALAAAPAAQATDSMVAAGPDGTFHFAWPEPAGGNLGYQTHERTLSAGGALGTAQPVSLAGTIGQSIDVDGAGNAVIAFSAYDAGARTVYARRRTADGTLTAVQRISPAGADTTERALAVDPDGDAVIVWSRQLSGKWAVQGRRRAADGTLGPVLTLSYAGAHSYHPAVGIAPDGTATVAWERITSTGRIIQARRIAPDGTVGEFARFSAAGETSLNPRIAVSDSGAETVAWQRAGSAQVLESRTRSPEGTLGPIQSISPAGTTPGQLAIAGNGAGRTAYAWVDAEDSSRGMLGRIRQPDGSLGPVFYLATGFGAAPRVAVAPTGAATFAWLKPNGGNTVQTRRRASTGAMGPVQTLSEAAVSIQDPFVDVGADGKALVLWVRNPSDIFARTITPGGTVSELIEVSG